jgi:hypothetical protein
MTDRQKQEVLGQRLVDEKGRPVPPLREGPAAEMSPAAAEAAFLAVCSALGMTDEQARASYRQQVAAGARGVSSNGGAGAGPT